MILMLRDQSFGEFSAHFKQNSVAKFQWPKLFFSYQVGKF